MFEAPAEALTGHQARPIPGPVALWAKPYLEDGMDRLRAVWFLGATHAETNLSAEENPSTAKARLHGKDVVQGWCARDSVKAPEGSLEADRLAVNEKTMVSG